MFDCSASTIEKHECEGLIAKMKGLILSSVLVGFWAATANADYDGNLNFRSPSLSHDGLGIDIPKVKGRMIEKRDGREYDTEELMFTHGIASVW